MAINKEKELLAQCIFTIFADNGVSIYMGFADKLADGLIARGYGRIDKFVEKLGECSGVSTNIAGETVKVVLFSKITKLLEEYKNDSNN